MFNKITTFKILKNGFEVLDNDFVKTASEMILPEDHKYDPDFLYMRVRAVSAGEHYGCNKNGDFFPEEELKQNYKTFLTAHTFKNHENKEVEKAIGDVIVANWNDKMKFIELLIRIDRNIAPSIVRGFEKGFMTDVSMGCRIKHSICSICGNIAKTQKEYCNHIKYEKHKIYPDGRKVYEINIGPTFHDISAVLNGADKTAKNMGLVIMGNKVAFYSPEEGMEKAASFETSLGDENTTPFYLTPQYHKYAKIKDSDSYDIFPVDENIRMQKIAEIKKRIQGRVMALANVQAVKNDNIEDVVRLLKLFYTDYWDEPKCKDIANSILEISKKREIAPLDAFKYFCYTAELAGIELTSLEFERILRFIGDYNTPTESIIKTMYNNAPIANVGNIMDDYERTLEMFRNNKNFSEIGDTFRGVTSDNFEHIGDNPIGVIIKAVTSSFKDNDFDDMPYMIDNDMMGILGREVPNRSSHYNHLIPRITRIIAVNKQPNIDNLMHFLLPLVLKSKNKTLIPLGANAYGYAAYQNSRERLASNNDINKGMLKFASIVLGDNSMESQLAEFADFSKSANIEKVGYSTIQAVKYGLPMTYGYSAMQRARMRNGENVSGFNRYVAENPGNAFVVQALLGPKMTKKTSRGIKNFIGSIADVLRSFKKIAEEDNSHLELMSKEASAIDELIDLDSSVDMFKSNEIDQKLLNKYSPEQSTAIKYATVMYELGREDIYDQILSSNKLNESDVNNYLKIATDSFKIEIEKNANLAYETTMRTFQDTLFNPIGVSTLALAPGSVLDGIIFTKLTGKMKKDAEKNKGFKEEVSK